MTIDEDHEEFSIIKYIDNGGKIGDVVLFFSMI